MQSAFNVWSRTFVPSSVQTRIFDFVWMTENGLLIGGILSILSTQKIINFIPQCCYFLSNLIKKHWLFDLNRDPQV